MTRSWQDIAISPGSARDDRLARALAANGPFVRPDTIAKALTQLCETAPPPWSKLLNGEPACLTARIMTFHIEDETLGFDLALERSTSSAAGLTIALAQRVLAWTARLQSQLSNEFGEILQGLERQTSLTTRSKLLARANTENLISRIHDCGIASADMDDQTTLRAAHRLMVHVIAALKPVAEKAFETRTKSGQIDPAIGLMIAELAAANEVDKRINQFTDRHTNFYYRDIIGQKLRDPPPDRALLHLPSQAVACNLPQGTELTARLDDGQTLTFKTDLETPITAARVQATAVLTYDTNPQISQYSALGTISGVRAAFEPTGQKALNRRVFTAPTSPRPVAMGLDIASHMLLLREGTRQVDVSLQMKRATDLPAGSSEKRGTLGDTPDPDIGLELRSDPELLHALGFENLDEGVAILEKQVHGLARERNCTASMDLIYEAIARKILTVEPLRILLGRITTLSLLENHPLPRGAYWDTLDARIKACGALLTGQASDRSGNLFETFQRNRNNGFVYTPADIFQKLLGDAFSVMISGEGGPVKPTILQLLQNIPLDGPDSETPPGITLRMLFDANCPALIPAPGEGFDTPVLKLRYGDEARVCPISFFERYKIAAIAFTVAVDGVTSLAGFSDDGALAPDQSFMPFGARPVDGASFTIAAPEMSHKPVNRISLDLNWADLPGRVGGFETHYANYTRGTVIPTPKVKLDYLCADGWKGLGNDPVDLIETDVLSGKLKADWHQTGTVRGQSIAATRPDTDALPKSRGELRAGALRLTLSETGEAFGQNRYPLALARAMRPRLTNLLPVKLPNPPYLPRVERMKLGYTATAALNLSDPTAAERGDKVIQITPFGRREIYPARNRNGTGLFPDRLGLGTLYIQLAGPGAHDRLGLLFDIADSGHLRLVPDPVPLHWHYLTASGWMNLPATAISSDSTDGLLRSGVITLDMPDDAQTPPGEMPEGGIWLAVSSPWRGFETHPVLADIRTNGVWATCQTSQEHDPTSPRSWSYSVAQKGLSQPEEISRRSVLPPTEDRRDYLARVSERLRHRQRAVTPWDIERLVLQAFPEIWRVKCLPHLTRRTAAPTPGSCTVVIVRSPPLQAAGTSTITQERFFDAGTLANVRRYLEKRASPQMRIEVVNPSFDRIQVRGTIRFASFSNQGAVAHRLQEYLDRQLSIWTAPKTLARFGWSLNVPTLHAQITALDYVRDVTDFSVLHFVSDDAGIYALADTAQSDGRGQMGDTIYPSRPWALPISAHDHALSVTENKTQITASQSGIGRLRVGDMLLVRQEDSR